MSKFWAQWEVTSGHNLKGKGCAIPTPFSLFPSCCFGMAKKQERGSQGLWNILWGKATTPALDHLCKREINFSLVQLTIISVSITCFGNCILTASSSFSLAMYVSDAYKMPDSCFDLPTLYFIPESITDKIATLVIFSLIMEVLKLYLR